MKNKKSSDQILTSDIHLRSEEIQEILSTPPRRILRLSITFIFSFLPAFFFLAWLIRYPDVVPGQVKITTLNPPVQQVSYTSGKIIMLNKKDNQKVEKDETIAIIENLLTEKTGRTLIKYIEKLKASLKTPATLLPLADTLAVFGEIQPDFNKLTSLIKLYNRIVSNPVFQNKINLMKEQKKQYNELDKLCRTQMTLAKREVEIVTTRYNINKELYEQKVIAKFDIFSEETQYILAQQRINDLQKIQVQNLISLTEIERQINELYYQYDEQSSQTIYSINEQIENVTNQLQQWEQRYLIKSPFDGVLSYANDWTVNDFIKQGENLFTVIPQNEEYIGVALVNSLNFGKVQTGQPVHMRMDSYPHTEAGELKGKIKSITLTPGTDNNYRIEITLDNGLTSTYKKRLEYKPDMAGTVQIITKDLSVLDRVFYQFRQLLSR